MTTNDHQFSVDVDAPVRVAYDQWTQFEEFPRFMNAVTETRQIADDMVHWRVDIGGISREFDTVITEQTPDQRVAWKTIDGPDHAGVVTFHPLDDHTTRVTLQMDYDPEGFFENVADTMGWIQGQLKADMTAFKQFIEDRSLSTGAWRGTIERG